MNPSRRLTIASLALGICLLWSGAAGLGQTGEKQSVKLKYPPGAYRLTLTSVSGGSTTIGNQEEKSQDQERMTWTFTVAPPDGQGSKKATLKLTEVQETSNGQETWNSAAPDKGQAAVAFIYRPIMAVDVQVVFDADEALVEVVGLDKVMAEIADAAQTAEHSVFGDKFIERQFRTMESLMPRSAVAVGDKWQAGLRVELPVVGEIRTRFDCVVKDLQAGKIVIGVTGLHELSRPKEVTVQGQKAIVTKLAVKDDVTLTVDLASGRVLGLDTISKGDISLTAKGQDNADINVAVKVDTKNTLALALASAEPAPRNAVMPAAAVNPPDKPAANDPLAKPAGKPGGVPVTYGVHHYIDEGGLRDPRTGQWAEGFSILVPKGWKFTGGFRWIAREKPPNLLSRTDMLNPVKSDYAITAPDGRSVFRQYPVEYWVQTNMFQPGQNYNGMIVCAALTPEQYLTQFVIPRQRGVQAADAKIVKQEPLDQLAAKYEAESQQFAAATGGAATGNALAFKAGTVTLDYTEKGVAYREQFLCIQQYLQTAGMVMWWPRMNFSIRAPRDQFEAQLPVFTTVALSVQTNPYWSIALIELREKIKVPLAQADAYANKVRHEIAAAHAQTNHELARDSGYLTGDYYDYKGTDGNRYNLPTDKYHFMNKDGDLLSQDNHVPPSSEWTSIEPYNQ